MFAFDLRLFDFLTMFPYTITEMIPFQERKKIRRILYSKPTLIALALVLIAVINGAWGIHQKAEIAISERDIAKRSLTELEARNAELNVSLERIRSANGKEEIIRQNFSVAKAGEEVVNVVDDSVKKSENGEASATKGFWQRIINFFAGN